MTVEIINYSEKHHEDFKRLSLEWLNKFDLYEDEDGRMLDNPKELILDEGGVIYMAELDGRIVGTIALKIITDDCYELHKLGVDSGFQGKGIGMKLMLYCLNYCKVNGVNKIILETNTKLKGAMHLYQKLGFKEAKMTNVKYEKSNYKMELDL